MPFVFGWRAIRLGLMVGVVVHRLRPTTPFGNSTRPGRGYPKIEARQGSARCRYAALMSSGGTGFLDLSHQVSTEM